MLEINPPMREGVFAGFDWKGYPSDHHVRWALQWEAYEQTVDWHTLNKGSYVDGFFYG